MKITFFSFLVVKFDTMSRKINIALFLSGTGSNARNFIKYFNAHPVISVALLLSNNKQSGAQQISADTGVPFKIVSREEYSGDKILEILQNYDVHSIILAGFLWLIPTHVIQKFPERIINIHPALLPKYGGKGMYGMHVHRTVKKAGESETGITIHLVNEVYDDGEILFQKKVSLRKSDTPEEIAQKVHQLEYEYFPAVTEKYLLNLYAV